MDFIRFIGLARGSPLITYWIAERRGFSREGGDEARSWSPRLQYATKGNQRSAVMVSHFVS